MTTIRQAAVAGKFYPQNPIELKETVVSLLNHAHTTHTPPKIVITPHAGYIYSGKTAALAYQALLEVAPSIQHIVLLGPSHHVAFQGLAIPSVDGFQTPLGIMPINKKALEEISHYPFVGTLDQAHQNEHSLEVQLPFLQTLFPNAQLTPIVVGDAPAEHVSQVIETLWGGPETLIVISTDLSHYLPYDTACSLDHQTSQAIIEKRINDIPPHQACGSRPLRGALLTASKLGLNGHIVDVRNSGDTAGPKDRVVGYGAYHFGQLDMNDMQYSDDLKIALLQLARRSITYGIEQGKMLESFEFPHRLITHIPQATFVTLEKQGHLRGCRGSLVAHKILALDVMQNAFFSAFSDPRFSPVEAHELKDIVIKISILSHPQPIHFNSESDLIKQLRPNIDGLWLIDGEHRGTFLPSVWESIPEPNDFLIHLKNKAGLPANYWSNTLTVQRYTTHYFGEPDFNLST
jgi:AmmeMemoRadiSam system protein B/AmmeMemoRadiSam system protein A